MSAAQLTKRLRKDLADVRTLVELSRKRESRKLGQVQIVQEVFNQIVFAHEARLRMAFENIVASVHFLSSFGQLNGSLHQIRPPRFF